MSRIRKAFEARFRALLIRMGARRVEQGVQWLLQRAGQQSEREERPLADALLQTQDRLQQRLAKSLARRASTPPHPAPVGLAGAGVAKPPSRFLCDAGLGGLARWLRAAGFEADWQPDVSDDALVREAQRTGAILLTTDSLLTERRLLRDGLLPSLWLPPTLKIPGQLRLVFREFHLRVGEPRCMSCGGELQRIPKETVWARIPPKTRLWLDEYFVCGRCARLFWRGTHWQRIQRALTECQECAWPDGPADRLPVPGPQ